MQDRRRLAMFLADGRWHVSRTINMEHRTIRAICAEFPTEFLSGQKGYKLVRYATAYEINMAVLDLRSRIKHLRDRAVALERAGLSRGGQRQLFTRAAGGE